MAYSSFLELNLKNTQGNYYIALEYNRMSKTIELYLTTAQFKKLESHKPFQVSFQQLNQNKPADHHVEIELPKPELTKLNRNLRNGKGFRFNPNKIIGSGLFSSGLSLLKTAAKSNLVKDLAKKGLSKAIQIGANSNNQYLAGAANLAGNVTGAGIFDTGLSLLKNAAKSKTVQNLGKQALSKAIQMGANSNNGLIAGASNALKSVTGGKLKKGSQEAKDHMARIRAMRKTGTGFNLIKSIKGAFKNPILKQIGNVALKTALPVALSIAKSNPYTAPLGMATQGILQSQGVSTGGKLTKRNISMPELIQNSYVRNPNALIVRGGSFKSL
jgi:hypothetical protein